MGGLETFRAEVGKTIESQTDQVFGGELGDLDVVPEDDGCSGVFVEPAGSVDNRDAGVFQPRGIEDAIFTAERNNSVTGPLGVKTDRARAEVEVAVDFQLPVSHRTGKIDDAVENFDGITGAGLQGDADAQVLREFGQNATKSGLNCYCGSIASW